MAPTAHTKGPSRPEPGSVAVHLQWVGRQEVVRLAGSIPRSKLRRIAELSTGEEDSGNAIIHADNLRALMALASTLHDRVDVAFLDPPYNAAREHWVYPDPVLDWFGSVVGAEGEDPLRHDKWLSMMYPRLAWLHVLLAESGALFLTLDDHEAHHARVLLDEIFGPENFLTNIAWERTRSPEDTGSPFLESHTHIIAYAKNARTWRPNPLAKKLPTIWDFEETHSVHGSPDLRLRPHGVTSSSLPFVPKPIKLLRRILRVAAGPNALVLDPFAGSGTTARAVLEQNASDGGDRKFILIEADDRAQALIARNLSAASGAPPAYGFYNLA